MPYCFIEEAWGSTFKNLKNIKNKQNRKNQLIKRNLYKCQNNKSNGPNKLSDGFDRNNDGKFSPYPFELKHKKYSRTMKKLDNTNGSERHNHKFHIINDIKKKKKYMEEFVNEEDDPKQIKYIRYLENKNNELKRLLGEKDSNDESYIFDLILYIVSGIFIIYMLDSFVSLIKYKNTRFAILKN